MLAEASRATILVEQWAADPNLFWADLLPQDQRPREWQIGFLDAFSDPKCRRVAVAACRAAGKSRAAALLSAWHLAVSLDSTVVVLAPISRQTQAVFTELRLIWQYAPDLRRLYPDWDFQQSEVKTGRPASRIIGLSSDQPQNIEGIHSPGPVLLVVDEARGLDESFWTSAQGMLDHPLARALVIGTPGARSGFFYRAFTKDGADLFDRTFQISAADIPRLQERYDAERKRLGQRDAVYRQQWEATFADVADWGLFEPSLLRRAQGRDPNPPTRIDKPFAKPPRRVLGLDPARTGDDCVLCFLNGKTIEKFVILPKADEMQTASATMIAARDWYADEVVVDVGGLGHSIATRLRQFLQRGDRLIISDFTAQAKARDESAANTKTEMLLRLRDALLDDAIGFPTGPDGDRLIRELLAVSIVQGRDGRVRSEDPKSKSPDFMDAALAALSARFIPPSCWTGRVPWA